MTLSNTPILSPSSSGHALPLANFNLEQDIFDLCQKPEETQQLKKLLSQTSLGNQTLLCGQCLLSCTLCGNKKGFYTLLFDPEFELQYQLDLIVTCFNTFCFTETPDIFNDIFNNWPLVIKNNPTEYLDFCSRILLKCYPDQADMVVAFDFMLHKVIALYEAQGQSFDLFVFEEKHKTRIGIFSLLWQTHNHPALEVLINTLGLTGDEPAIQKFVFRQTNEQREANAYALGLLRIQKEKRDLETQVKVKSINPNILNNDSDIRSLPSVSTKKPNRI